jgi:hypothetical protein
MQKGRNKTSLLLEKDNKNDENVLKPKLHTRYAIINVQVSQGIYQN